MDRRGRGDYVIGPMTNDIRFSKMLSLWLRHQPDAAGLTLDPQGWTEVDAVLAALVRGGVACDWQELLLIVEESDKQRFELSDDANRIRARQGHSVAVDSDRSHTSRCWPGRVWQHEAFIEKARTLYIFR